MQESIAAASKEQREAMMEDLEEEMGYSASRHVSRQRSSINANRTESSYSPTKQLSQILNPKNDYFPGTMSKPLSRKFTDNAVEIVKIGNVVCSLAGWLYFSTKGNNANVVLEYAQVCFLAILMNILDSTDGWKRWFWFTALIIAGAGWSTVTVETFCSDAPLSNQIAWSLMCIFYDLGTIAAAYVSLQHPVRFLKSTSFLELDLMLYLVSLNALCIFPITHFNSNLHMLLDIRMVVLLYTGLYRPIDKMALLRRKSFLFIIFCTLIFFILVTNPSPLYQLLGSIVNIGLGGTLLTQSVYFYLVKYPRIRKAQATEVAWEQEQLHAEQQKALDEEIRLAGMNSDNGDIVMKLLFPSRRNSLQSTELAAADVRNPISDQV